MRASARPNLVAPPPNRAGSADGPLVSIVVPVFNASSVIQDTIRTVFNQSYSNWELIMVDDRSQDDGAKAIEMAADRDTRVRLLSLPSNVGAGKARNAGIEAATGKYLAFLDADDLWAPTKLEKQVLFMQSQRLSFTYTGYEYVSMFGELTGKLVRVPQKISYWEALKNTIIWTSTVMLDIGQLDARWCMMPDLRRGQDTATWWSLLKRLDFAFGLQEVLAYYRRAPGTLSHNKLKALQRTWRLYRDVERMSVIESAYFFSHYLFNAIRRRL